MKSTSTKPKASKKAAQAMGQLLNPMDPPQPGDPMTKLYANPQDYES